MLLESHTREVEGDLAGFGETRAFTLSASGKAFRLLVDGLYSDKIAAPVRELTSNAWDAHIAAGCPERPFVVQLPTQLDCVFSVRDYGPGMDHQTMMVLYTTMFGSSKDTSNDFNGAFGIGSKSPFAYTDTFTVNAYDGQEVREYLAFMTADGVPNLTHMGTSPSREERGILVSFPVRPHDADAFHRAWLRVREGFVVQPEMIGRIPDPLPGPKWVSEHGAGTWAVYGEPSDYGYSGDVLVRQGCVVYPLRNISSPLRDTRMIITVPIGTYGVTATREDLELTPEVVRDLEARVARVFEEILVQLQVAIDAAPNWVEACQAAHNRDVTLRLNTNHKKWTWKGRPLQAAVEIFPGHAIGYHTARVLKLVVTRPGQVVPRQASRLASYRRDHGKDLVLVVDTKEVKRLVKLLCLKPEQVVPIAQIPDVKPPARGPRTGKLKGFYTYRGNEIETAEDLPDEFFYAIRIGRTASALRLPRALGLTDSYTYVQVVPSSEERAKKMGGTLVDKDHLIALAEPHRATTQAKLDARHHESELYHLNKAVREALGLPKAGYSYATPVEEAVGQILGLTANESADPLADYPMLRKYGVEDEDHLTYIGQVDTLKALQ